MTRFFSLTGAIFLLAATSLGSSAFADDYDERLAIANDYAAMAAADMDMEAIIDQMWKPMVEAISASGKTVSDEQAAEIQTLFQESFAEPLMELMANQGPIMAEVYTLEELTALHAFYMTPEGRSVMSKMPRVMEKQQPEIMAFTMNNMGPIMQAVQEILQ